MWSNILDRVSYWSLYLVVVLMPVFFLPFAQIPVEIGKGFLLVVGLSVSIIFYLGARFTDGKIRFARSHILLAAFGVTIATLLSALFSHALDVSLFGTMLDVSSALFILCAFLLMFMSSIMFKDPKKAKHVLFSTFVSFGVVLVFQIIHLTAPLSTSMGILNQRLDNLLGSWNSLGMAIGALMLMAIFVLEFFELKKLTKILLISLIVVSLLMTIIINFPLLWTVLGIFSLLIFVYKVSIFSSKGGNQANFPAFSFAIVMISLLFFMSGQFIQNYIPQSVSVANIEVGPSAGATLSVAKSSLAKNPVFGIGPNRFGSIWSLYKPQSINTTDFWDTPFSVGSGFIPTMAVTTGLLGVLAWIAFIIIFVWSGSRILFRAVKEGTKWEVPVFLIASFYLIFASILYSTGVAIVLLAFAYTGIFVGVHNMHIDKGEIEFSFLGDPRRSFFAILALVLVMVITAGATFKYLERFTSVHYFRNAINAEDVAQAEYNINKAVSLYSNDLYLRTYSQVYLAKLNTLVAKVGKDANSISEADKADITSSIQNALAGANLAVSFDKNNYLNNTALAFVYQSIAPFGYQEAYESQIKSYNDALSLNPLNPGLKLAIAQAYLAQDKYKEAEDFAKQSLELKANYADALIVLSQIAKKTGRGEEALSYAKQALSIYPNNQNLIDYVSSLKGNNAQSTEVSNDTDTKTTDKKKKTN